MRGLPGAGKDHWIKEYQTKHYQFPQHWIICSADHYHMVNGVYQYKPERAREAHDECLGQYLTALLQPTDVIFVNNTNSTLLELAPYYRLAEYHKAEVKIIQVMCDFQVACRRNVHDVPPRTIWKMYQNILTERLPGHWPVEIINQ